MSRSVRIAVGSVLILVGVVGYALRAHVTGVPPAENWWRPVWTYVSYAFVAGGAYVVATGLLRRTDNDRADD